VDSEENSTRLPYRTALLLAILVGPWLVFALLYWVTPQSDEARPLEIPARGPLTIAATGDMLIFNPLSDAERDPALQDTISRATFAIATLDLNLLGPDEAKAAEGRPQPRWPFGSAREAQSLRTLGFDAVALANDHGGDYGVDGTLSTMRILSAAGLLHAGTGTDLAQARAPVYAGVPRRLALISVTSSSLPEARATATRADVRGRPGVNPLRYAADITVDAGTFQTLKNSIATLNAGPPARADELTMFGTPIRKGERTAVSFTVDENDEREILDEIKTARTSAEAVIVSLHSHEPANASDTPSEFAQRFARRAIDAGATLVIGHGPHRLRGIEFYNGGVILYSLGNLVYQTAGLDFRAANVYDAGADLYRAAIGALGVNPQSSAAPPDDPAWWEGAIALATIDRGRLESLRLVPVDLGGDKPLEGKGIPRIVREERATAILRRVSELSQSLGTAVQIEAGTGLVRGNPPRQ